MSANAINLAESTLNPVNFLQRKAILTDSLIEQIRAKPDLSRSERKVADVVTARPEDAVLSTISELAQRSDVSEPTVLRFCRSLGFAGFQEFKVVLAEDMGKSGRSRAAFAHVPVDADDPMPLIVRKVVDTTIQTFLDVEQGVDTVTLSRVVELLLSAGRIDFYGFGASAVVAADARDKFFRLNIPTNAWADPHMQAVAASTLQPGDAVVAISSTGRSRELLTSLAVAQSFGARTIAITASGSPLADTAETLIAVDTTEDVDFVTPMTSRLAHLLVIDILAVAVAARRPDAVGKLAPIKRTLRALKMGRSGDHSEVA